MAVAIAWLPGPAGTRRRVAKPSVEEPDAAEPARPDLWGARVSNDPGLPDRDQASRHVSLVLQSRAKESHCGVPIPSRWYEEVKDVTVLIHGAPQVLLATLDRDEPLVGT